MEHPPWTLHAGAVETCDVDALFRDAGLPAPVGSPLVHHSPGVKVRVGPPQPVSDGDATVE